MAAARCPSLPRPAEAYRVTNKLAAPQGWRPRDIQACRVSRKLTAPRGSVPCPVQARRVPRKRTASQTGLPCPSYPGASRFVQEAGGGGRIGVIEASLRRRGWHLFLLARTC